MSEIRDLAEARRKRTEHLSGPAFCYNCDHEWTAVAPTGAEWLECPRCRREFARYAGITRRPGLVWTCKCGCDVFRITDDYVAYCVDCGLFHEDTVRPQVTDGSINE